MKRFDLPTSLSVWILIILITAGCATTPSPLIEAASRGDNDTVKALLAKGEDVNVKNEVGQTALIFASREGHLKVVKELIANGADVNAKDKGGTTALITSSANGHLEVVKELIASGVDVNAKTTGDKTPLGKFHSGYTALFFASQNDHTEVVKELIASGADVNAKPYYGTTALMNSAIKGNAEIMKQLIANGADVNAKDKGGWTALIFASGKNHPEVVKELIANGADVNAKKNDGLTALNLAEHGQHLKIIELLKEVGAAEGKRGFKNFFLNVKLGKDWKTTKNYESQTVTFKDFDKQSRSYRTILVRENDASGICEGSHSVRCVADAFRKGEETDMIARGVKKGMYKLKDLEKFELKINGKKLYAMTYKQLLKGGLIGYGYLYLYFPDFEDSNKFYVFLYSYLYPSSESRAVSLEEFYSVIKGFNLK